MLVIATDIFGCTPELTECAEQLAPSNYRVISPFSADQCFDNEALGYAEFVQQGGMDTYIQRLKLALNQVSQPVDLLGFSAGGAAAFAVCSAVRPGIIRKSWCFYPGQVRHFTHLTPKVDCQITFAAKEPHFDVSEVVTVMQDKANLHLETSESSHGFMNQRSKGFDLTVYQQYLMRLRKWLEAKS